MRESISFQIVRDQDGSGELIAELQSNEFSGRGSAYFDLGFLLLKAKEFSAYPLMEGGVTLVGGILDRDDLSKLKQEHIRISARPVGLAGQVAVRIFLAEPTDNGLEIRRCVSAEIGAEYVQLAALSSGLAALAEGRGDSFAIEFHE